MKKHFFFDMDGTVTESRQPIADNMAKAIKKIIEADGDVVIVSGAKNEIIKKQLAPIIEECAILAQNGNDAEKSIGTPLWNQVLNWRQKKHIFNLCERLSANPDVDWTDELDIVEDRGCQISFSCTGHNAPREKKNAYDPDRSKRRILMDSSVGIDELKDLGIRCAIGGSTCLDFFVHNKGDNVKQFIYTMGWLADECVYAGDALDENGNDASVIGVIDTVPVAGPSELIKHIKEWTVPLKTDYDERMEVIRQQQLQEDEEERKRHEDM